MGNDSITAKDLTWTHVSQVGEADLAAMQEQFKFHHLDYEDIKAESPISKMDAYKHYIFFVFHIPTVHKDTGHVHGEELYIFLDKNQIVTVTHVPIKTLNAFFARLQKSPKFRSSVMTKGSAHLMYRILMEVFKQSMSIVAKLTQEVTQLEEDIETHHKKRITVDLAHARRNILFIRHIIDPQRNILSNLSHTNRIFISEETRLYFDDLHDLLDTVWLTTDNLKLIIDGLFDVNEALLSHKTNEIVTLLTIMSASLMVPTLIAGFYGMNVQWLPLAERAGFVYGLYLFGFVIVVALVIMVVRRPRL